MPRLPNTISFRRLSEISRRRAASSWPNERLQKFLEQDFARGHRRPEPVRSPVIVFDRDFEGMPVLPSKRDAILIVYANAVSHPSSGL